MTKIKTLAASVVFVLALTMSAAAMAQKLQPGTQTESCCDMKDCCKDAAMSCCKKKKHGQNAHACCGGKGGAAACCCKGDSCPMPNKKASNSNSN